MLDVDTFRPGAAFGPRQAHRVAGPANLLEDRSVLGANVAGLDHVELELPDHLERLEVVAADLAADVARATGEAAVRDLLNLGRDLAVLVQQ